MVAWNISSATVFNLFYPTTHPLQSERFRGIAALLRNEHLTFVCVGGRGGFHLHRWYFCKVTL